MLGVWTAIKTASEVAEEVGWKRVIQRELDGRVEVGLDYMDSLCCFSSFSQVVGGHSSCKGKSNQSSVKYGCSLVKGKANHPMENYHIAKFVHVQRARAWAF
ncbi:hypothetical protein JHK87_050485 [Glycine soja]|nr:hypothetical protein JHK87_050485 [Glycine soja]